MDSASVHQLNPSQFVANSINTWDTLDEPIWDTVYRDVSSIGLKLKYILLPLSESDVYLNVCKNWDLWGPFVFCTYIAFSLNNCGEQCNGYHQSNFSSIFILLWIGNIIISTNYKLILSNRLKSENSLEVNIPSQSRNSFPLSIFQLLCLLGYCLAIPSIGLLILQISSILASTSSNLFFIVKILIILVFGLIYPIVSVLKILSRNLISEKYFLVTYPIFMFYLLLGLYSFTFV